MLFWSFLDSRTVAPCLRNPNATSFSNGGFCKHPMIHRLSGFNLLVVDQISLSPSGYGWFESVFDGICSGYIWFKQFHLHGEVVRASFFGWKKGQERPPAGPGEDPENVWELQFLINRPGKHPKNY